MGYKRIRTSRIASDIQTFQFSSIQSLSCVWHFATPCTAACQASLSITNSQSLTQTHVHWVSDAIQPSHPLSSPSPPTFNLSQHKGLFKWVNYSHQFSESTSVLPMNIQDWFPLGCTGGFPGRPRYSQESSPTPQFKSINSSALTFLHSPTLTSIHDYWKNHSFD